MLSENQDMFVRLSGFMDSFRGQFHTKKRQPSGEGWRSVFTVSVGYWASFFK